MSLTYKILGKPGRDNALFVWINSGNNYHRLLFDCGEDVLRNVNQSDVKSIDHVFFSHLHIDHIAGFDYFFRRNYDRDTKPVSIWGPEDTASIIHHRLLGYKWNLISGSPGNWLITEFNDAEKITFSFKASEAFQNKIASGPVGYSNIILEEKDFIVKEAILNHRIGSAAYRIEEKPSFNILKEKLEEMNLPHGPWLEKIKDFSIKDSESISVEGKIFVIGELRSIILAEKKRDSIAYMTDFIYDDTAKQKGIELISGCDTLICESQYLSRDEDLALKNFHLTAAHAARLARGGNVKKLILFHISDRYMQEKEYLKLLDEARTIFPESYFPEEW